MKKLMIMMLMLGAFASCTKNTETPEKPKDFRLDKDAMLYVNGGGTKAETETAEYIVKNASFLNRAFLKDDGTLQRYENGEVDYGSSSLGLDDDSYDIHRDIKNNKFKFFGSDIFFDGKPIGSFFEWVDMTFTVAVHNGKRIFPKDVTMPFEEVTQDTVAYIPNSVARECKAKILKAFEAGDLEECYRIFREDYSFVPITGEQLRKLKAEGKDNIFE